LATKPETKKALAVLQKFVEQEKAFKALEVAKKEAEATLLQAMIEHDIVKLEGDWGYVTKAVRKSFKGFHPDFAKTVLDTTKVAAHVTLTGSLPEGVEQSETAYITKRFKS
jgi:ribosomal protein S17